MRTDIIDYLISNIDVLQEEYYTDINKYKNILNSSNNIFHDDINNEFCSLLRGKLAVELSYIFGCCYTDVAIILDDKTLRELFQ